MFIDWNWLGIKEKQNDSLGVKWFERKWMPSLNQLLALTEIKKMIFWPSYLRSKLYLKLHTTHCVVSIEIAFDKSLFRIFHNKKTIVKIRYSYLKVFLNFLLKVCFIMIWPLLMNPWTPWPRLVLTWIIVANVIKDCSCLSSHLGAITVTIVIAVSWILPLAIFCYDRSNLYGTK